MKPFKRRAAGPDPLAVTEPVDDLYVPPRPEPEESIQHSLFGEILDWMLAPLLLLWPMSIAITYLVAKSIANQPFDHALEDSVTVLAQQVKEVDGRVVARLPGTARDILRADDVDSVYFQISGPRGEIVDGDRDLPPPNADDAERSGRVHFRTETLHGAPVRIAYAWVNLQPLLDATQEPRLALVQVAETLDKRAQLANEIIKGVILPQFIILPVILALVWFALSRGLSPLAQLQERIRARPPDDLSPIDSRQVPEEISPLVGSLNDMLARLAHTIAVQKRFIADAAHQMKTPLAGMRMQSELALRQVDPNEIHRSLEQLAKSSESATRLVNQLLALARAENQPHAGQTLEPLDLAALARDVVQDWVQASFAHEIDLGYEVIGDPPEIDGSAMMLRELLSNLIDNALRYTPPGGSVTVRVRGTNIGNGNQALLEVEDTGPGIAPSERHRVFERFYRILGSSASGSGLGLAIVREIAQQHGADIEIFNNPRSTHKKFPGSLFRLTFPPTVTLVPDADRDRSFL
ncbi:sensor histidine kinase N-terminal domain-containing protein [Telluria mixta]|uniref:histidine kinase n=1 Tax=Telluria mixta TaxID=34071 RepID=A0ABT2C2H6_9BURK|nr:sensor histidine kinase [Telluria mixta]MCS0631588.1 sensor histidine kinase N-terminal domain-containing protein [Telluria mixta]WEM98341.1 sensor histidine kinase N-terminal domain-containing protein [Telluria mixta]